VERVRIDKWLWAARFYKTRALAVKACDLGRVSCNGQSVKPSRDVHVGDRLSVKNDSGEFQIEVLQLSDMRGPASVAQTLYVESEESREARRKAAEERRLMPFFEPLHAGRPSKKDRRKLERFRFARS
jgi:ribosome-associated heat shock protein Hsp15